MGHGREEQLEADLQLLLEEFPVHGEPCCLERERKRPELSWSLLMGACETGAGCRDSREASLALQRCHSSHAGHPAAAAGATGRAGSRRSPAPERGDQLSDSLLVRLTCCPPASAHSRLRQPLGAGRTAPCTRCWPRSTGSGDASRCRGSSCACCRPLACGRCP